MGKYSNSHSTEEKLKCIRKVRSQSCYIDTLCKMKEKEISIIFLLKHCFFNSKLFRSHCVLEDYTPTRRHEEWGSKGLLSKLRTR